jgi:anti-sigma regulatory factor (Ser/Thr protein kinase)
MSARFETQVLAQPAAISELTDAIMDYLAAEGVDARTAHHVALAFDELLTNLGSHGGSADKPATVRIFIEPGRVKAEILDSGPAFDIRDAPEPDLSLNIDDRPVGGLGLFLIRQLASEIGYDRRDGMNCTTFAIKRSSGS